MPDLNNPETAINALVGISTAHLTLAAAATGGLGALAEGSFKRFVGLIIAVHMAPFTAAFLWLIVIYTHDGVPQSFEITRRALRFSGIVLFAANIIEVATLIAGVIIYSPASEGFVFGFAAAIIVAVLWACMAFYMFKNAPRSPSTPAIPLQHTNLE
ncbi:hypothetical protein V8F20_011607 [Naviculisporaceae sp. PSN 640]